MKVRNILCYFVVCSLIYSCFIIAEIPKLYETDNVYKNLNMQVFKGFIDKMPVTELLDIYGKPDTILDAYKVAKEKGFDIYEYSFPDGNLHCYIKHGINVDEAIVDYIYYEPKNNIKLKDFVYSDSLCAIIQKETSVVYYIYDEFNNFIRFRLDSDNREEIVNIALNDVSQLDERESVSSDVKEIRENLPLLLGDIGVIDKIVLEDKDLQIYITVDESPNLKLPNIVKQNPDWATTLTVYLFNSFGIFKGKTGDIIRECVNVKFYLYGNVSKTQEVSVIYSDKFRKLLKNGISNVDRMANDVSFGNLTLPFQVNDYLILCKEEIIDGKLVVPFILKGTKEDYKEITNKEYNTSMLTDYDNPERDDISLCARCNYGYQKVYYIYSDESADTVVIRYSPEEIKKIRKQM